MDLKADFKQAYSASHEFTKRYLFEKDDWSEVPKDFAKLMEFRTFREIYASLIHFSITRQSVTFGELARFTNRRLGEDVLPTQGSWLGRSLGEILGAVNIYEFYIGRPLISVVVVNATTRKPGDGFFSLVRTMGLKVKETCERERVFIAWGGYRKR